MVAGKPLKVYAATNYPIVPPDVIAALDMQRHNRQAGLVLVTAESKAEAARMLAVVYVDYTRNEFGLADMEAPQVQALRAAGQLDSRKVLALSNYQASRVVRVLPQPVGVDHIGWVIDDDGSGGERTPRFVPASEVTQDEVDALACVIGAPGRKVEALRVLAAGYRLTKDVV